MSGANCQWRYWFQAHHYLNEKARVFDDPAWIMRHSRMLTQLEQELHARGIETEVEYEVGLPVGKEGGRVSGRLDCLGYEEAAETFTVYECKTVAKKQKHALQVLLYMHLLSKGPRFRDKGIRGMLVYESEREELRALPDGFGSEVDFWLQLLTSATPPRKVPGSDCRYCPIASVDCPERQEFPSDDGLDESDV
jgi:hypothetical protein